MSPIQRNTVKFRVRRDPLTALPHNRIGTANSHELFERIAEGALVAVCRDRARGVGRIGQSLQPGLTDTCCGSFRCEFLLPALETGGVIAAGGGHGPYGCAEQEAGHYALRRARVRRVCMRYLRGQLDDFGVIARRLAREKRAWA
jgi:hypothetical protein